MIANGMDGDITQFNGKYVSGSQPSNRRQNFRRDKISDVLIGWRRGAIIMGELSKYYFKISLCRF